MLSTLSQYDVQSVLRESSDIHKMANRASPQRRFRKMRVRECNHFCLLDLRPNFKQAEILEMFFLRKGAREVNIVILPPIIAGLNSLFPLEFSECYTIQLCSQLSTPNLRMFSHNWTHLIGRL